MFILSPSQKPKRRRTHRPPGHRKTNRWKSFKTFINKFYLHASINNSANAGLHLWFYNILRLEFVETKKKTPTSHLKWRPNSLIYRLFVTSPFTVLLSIQFLKQVTGTLIINSTITVHDIIQATWPKTFSLAKPRKPPDIVTHVIQNPNSKFNSTVTPLTLMYMCLWSSLLLPPSDLSPSVKPLLEFLPSVKLLRVAELQEHLATISSSPTPSDFFTSDICIACHNNPPQITDEVNNNILYESTLKDVTINSNCSVCMNKQTTTERKIINESCSDFDATKIYFKYLEDDDESKSDNNTTSNDHYVSSLLCQLNKSRGGTPIEDTGSNKNKTNDHDNQQRSESWQRLRSNAITRAVNNSSQVTRSRRVTLADNVLEPTRTTKTIKAIERQPSPPPSTTTSPTSNLRNSSRRRQQATTNTRESGEAKTQRKRIDEDEAPFYWDAMKTETSSTETLPPAYLQPTPKPTTNNLRRAYFPPRSNANNVVYADGNYRSRGGVTIITVIGIESKFSKNDLNLPSANLYSMSLYLPLFLTTVRLYKLKYSQ